MQCGLMGYDLTLGFNELANEMSITGPDGAVCYHPVHSWQVDINDVNADAKLASNLTCSVMYEFVNLLLVRLNLTTECCLENGTACGHHHQRNRTSVAEGIHTLIGTSKVMYMYMLYLFVPT